MIDGHQCGLRVISFLVLVSLATPKQDFDPESQCSIVETNRNDSNYDVLQILQPFGQIISTIWREMTRGLDSTFSLKTSSISIEMKGWIMLYFFLFSSGMILLLRITLLPKFVPPNPDIRRAIAPYPQPLWKKDGSMDRMSALAFSSIIDQNWMPSQVPLSPLYEHYPSDPSRMRFSTIQNPPKMTTEQLREKFCDLNLEL
eukprot:TRINITY_DN8573_c0_g1_i1.p1 TRINITY_DN8573_c0_g1~~TRINITY_DN8573_c0_g1_i1.p1  ORF type:complete len:201 (+),score=27.27 TRINITY_DN8573_c0_g1_i1:429-1031(+)